MRSRAPRGPGPALRRIVLAATLLAMGAVAGCSSARASLGTVDGGCFLALPTGAAAVHHHGRLLGAELATVEALRHRPVILRTVTRAPGPKIRQVCLVAFGGSFTRGSVERPVGQRSGRVAVVVVEYPHSRLLGTVVLNRAPVRFGHSHVGQS